MKKKILKIIAAAAAVMSMSATVMAAGSIVGAIDMPGISASRGSVSLTKTAPGMYGAELQEAVDRLNGASGDTTVAEAFGEELPEINIYTADGLQTEKADMSQYKFLSPVMELQITDVVPTEENPVTVTFVANNMTDYIEVDVLHYCEEHKWEVLKGNKVSANQIAADFHSASPVALIYRQKAAATTATDVKAPQTGERPVLPLAAGTVLFSGLGLFAVKKSRRYSDENTAGQEQ
ncbi:LPXTG cell wall anchor domain-containing protein [Murimonas intestini]|uniref:LPXTG-motif cell wall-anchored protein n=1 Tax=Murimonas intestini TaxID=1337051 RepID=A0AB73T7V7_9FIRM|nr:LPXTG cell wall anchor domain-containing protein [Murimonas intestini]MCR1839779.1 LPXTG cell wall anchor domain-containing protein [Murimonas intestini]MCR1866621.1 LPXTG cell wall anchor domain-containing protein [Murimonas intestini]MCR1884755.1 LPXTG cell wall anchor domain-containing protein [Murimonas intestini]